MLRELSDIEYLIHTMNTQGCVYGTKTAGERSSLPTASSRTDVAISNR